MTEEKKLGKIKAVSVGFGGYDDAMFGVDFCLGGDCWSCGDFWGTWASPPSDGTSWTLADQSKFFADTTRRLIELCKQAKVLETENLVGKPIEITFENMSLKSWRILTECI